MTISPTGRILHRLGGVDIVISRLIRGTVDDVWASVTESERTARWFGRWEGEAAPGNTIRVQMAFEEGDVWTAARIESCAPPTFLSLYMGDAGDPWLLDLTLIDRGERTELTLTQHRADAGGAGEIGPGWEYYLDNLIASRENTALPDFNDYYPELKVYFEEQAQVVNANSESQ
jgi:uncharacterized protein YndB with AHSA1/START domain